MNAIHRHILEVPPGFRSREAALFFTQLEDQSRRLTEDTRGLTARELEWQPAPGMNSIGMLLAHLAIVEVMWVQIGPVGKTKTEVREVLEIGQEDDGMPLDPGGGPPRVLLGRELGFFDTQLARARAHTRQALEHLADADLDREVSRTRRDGIAQVLNLRWILYHVLEHEAAHYGQINLLRHHQRVTVGETR